MNKEKTLVPFFRRGDIGGVSYAVTNNIVNYLIVIATLTGVLGWPDDIVFGFVVPGMSIGLMLGCFYYAWMGYKLSKKEGRADVTALPSGRVHSGHVCHFVRRGYASELCAGGPRNWRGLRRWRHVLSVVLLNFWADLSAPG